MEKQNGITLISLVITIIVMIILAGVTTYSGIESVEETKRIAFISELEMIQAKVNTIHERIKTSDKEKEYYNKLGKAVDGTLLSGNLGITSGENFRYFSKTDLKQLDLENMTQDVLINYDTREVISVSGLRIDGAIYHRLTEIPNYTGQNIEYESEVRNNPTFAVEKTRQSNGTYEFKVTNITYNSNVLGGTVSYKMHDDANWILNGDNMSFTITKPGLYDIRFTDKAGSSTIVQDFMYVQDGLSLYLDGEQNTREGHKTSPTTWEDLSGNSNDATGSVSYDEGQKGYVFSTNETNLTTSKSVGLKDQYTIEIVENGNTLNSYKKDIEEITKAGGAEGEKTTQDKVTLKKNGQTETTITSEQFQSLKQSIENGQVKVGKQMHIGENTSSSYSMQVVRIYNRLLTDEERKINYEIDKFRFKIP